MASPITPVSIVAPGFYGLNLQDSPVDLDQKYALEATNCVIDKSGRIGARKGWAKSHATLSAAGTSDFQCIHESITTTGTSTIVGAANNKLFKLSGSTLSELTYGGGGVAPTITDDNWQAVSINGAVIFFQRGYDPLVFDPSVSATTYKRVNEHGSYAGTIAKGHCALSAFGRIWIADTDTDGQTLTYSDLLSYMVYSGGTSGTLNISQVWPNGADKIMALGEFNGKLIIFGKTQIVIYKGPEDPSTMSLDDTISNVGCIARDTVQNIGSDLLFLSHGGVAALSRTIQEKSAPLRTVSKNINDTVIGYLDAETTQGKIRGGYSPKEQMYVLALPTTKVAFYFDLRGLLQDGSARAAFWTSINPRAFYSAIDGTFYIGKAGYICEYSGYNDDTSSYYLRWFSTWIDFGNPIQHSILKKILATLIGASNQLVTFRYGFDYVSNTRAQSVTFTGSGSTYEYGDAEYSESEYSTGVTTGIVDINPGGEGQVIQVGLEVQINGNAISIQRVDVFTKNGKV